MDSKTDMNSEDMEKVLSTDMRRQTGRCPVRLYSDNPDGISSKWTG